MKQNVKIALADGRELSFTGEAQVTGDEIGAGTVEVVGVEFTEPYEGGESKPAPVEVTMIPKGTAKPVVPE